MKLNAAIGSIFAAVTVLCGCSSPPSTSTDSFVAPEPASPNDQPVALQPRVSAALQSEYQVSRAAFEQLWDFSPIIDSPSEEDSEINLGSCSGPSIVVPHEELVGRSRSVYLAYDIAYMISVLRAAGIPETQWSEKINLFEQQNLPEFEGEYFRPQDFDRAGDDNKSLGRIYGDTLENFMNNLATDINNSRIMRHRTFYGEYNCGGFLGEQYEIVAIPADPDLYLISRWSALVCDGRRIPVNDRGRCRGWRPVSTPSLEPLTGDLLYISQWPNGVRSQGEISFRGRSEIERVTITPRGVSYQQYQGDF